MFYINFIFFNIETIGSLSQITRPCPIKYKSMKVQHQQVKLDRRQTLTEFIKEDEVNLKRGKQYDSTHMAVTSLLHEIHLYLKL
jgi:hypothetical protein